MDFGKNFLDKNKEFKKNYRILVSITCERLGCSGSHWMYTPFDTAKTCLSERKVLGSSSF